METTDVFFPRAGCDPGLRTDTIALSFFTRRGVRTQATFSYCGEMIETGHYSCMNASLNRLESGESESDV